MGPGGRTVGQHAPNRPSLAPRCSCSTPTSAVDPRLLNISEPIQDCTLDGVSVVPSPYDVGTWNRVLRPIGGPYDDQAQLYRKGQPSRSAGRCSRQARGTKPNGTAGVRFLPLNMLLPWTTPLRMTTGSMSMGSTKRRRSSSHGATGTRRLSVPSGFWGVSPAAWDGLRWKLCIGLMSSRWNHGQTIVGMMYWYHGFTMEYIPIRADVISDLHERYQWTQDHPDRAEAMAAAGRTQCLKALGPDRGNAHYRAAVQSIPAADLALESAKHHRSLKTVKGLHWIAPRASFPSRVSATMCRFLSG
jgi:hypothetical protein